MSRKKNKNNLPAQITSSSLIPSLDFDYTKDPADAILPCTERQLAGYLGWTVAEVRSVNKALGLYEHLPMICEGEGCYWARMCPTAKTDPPFLFLGLKCPFEQTDICRTFIRYVRELSVQHHHHVDLNLILDLCRLDLQIKRMDQQLQVQGMMGDHVAGITRMTEKVIYEKVVHPLLVEQSNKRRDRDRIYKSLLANRAERFKVDQATGKNRLDMFELFDQFSNLGKAVHRDQPIDTTARITELPNED